MSFGKKEEVSIKAPNMQTIEAMLLGTAPLVIHKFSQKAILEMRAKQELGSVAKKGTKKEAKDFDAVFNGARHISIEGWDGIPASAFRCAIISACKLVGFTMSRAKLSVFIEADGFDATEGTPLVRIIGPKPRKLESMVRIGSITKTTDITARPQWLEWGCKLRVRFDADQFSKEDIFNLLMRVGIQVGICEGRPDSKTSAGMGWGTFKIINDEKEFPKDENKGGK